MERSQNAASLRKKLDELYFQLNTKDYLDTDPIGVVHEYSQPGDQELVAYVASMMAFGSAKLIRQACRQVFQDFGSSPLTRLRDWPTQQIQRNIQFQTYRFYQRGDILKLLLALRKILLDHQNLESLFKTCKSPTTQERFLLFQKKIQGASTSEPQTYGWKYLFPNPSTGVAKRVHLFLRWVVRKDDIDLGLWKSLSPSELSLPVDTHVFQVGRKLGLIRHKSLSVNCVHQATEQLRKINPEDPIRYDFSLCRLGMLKLQGPSDS